MLINVKNKFVAPLHLLARLSIKYVYDRKHMDVKDVKLMKDSVVSWSKKIDITAVEQFDLMRIGSFLQKDEDGKFDQRKEDFRKHDIKWGKFHRLPDWEKVQNSNELGGGVDNA